MILFFSFSGILDLAVLMWSGHSLFHLFSYQKIGQEFFNRDILDRFDKILGCNPRCHLQWGIIYEEMEAQM